jgi:hypothetical protein
VKPTFLTVVAFIGVLAFLVLFIADREMQSGIERLSRYRFSPRFALDAGEGLQLAGWRRPVRPAAAGRWFSSGAITKGRREYVPTAHRAQN